MAHIGSPSAGWYTDPSGAHRARYWDGAAWTEQVRDDLVDTAPSSNGAASAANPMAATVAEVAQAVTNVANAEGSWTPVTEPNLVGMAGADAPTPWITGAATTTTAMESALVAPVPTGPAPGWYPDPAERHQARYWDGTTWTERVADNGVEARDPIPGVAAAAVAGETAIAASADALLHPENGAWTAQLVGAVDEAGAPISAGQASLAKLPATEDGGPDDRVHVRPTGKVRVAGGMVLGGGVALLLGSAMTWMKVRGPGVNDFSSSSGLSLGDGRITIILAIALAVLGAAILTGRMQKFGGPRVAAMGALVAGAAAAAVTAVDIADVADRASRLGVPPGAVTDVGIGLWLCFMGAMVAVAGGLLAFNHRGDRR